MAPPATTLQITHLPSRTLVGIDLTTFSSSPLFTGISKFPPGFHFLYTGADASLSIRHGEWFWIPGARNVVTSRELAWRWDGNAERLERVSQTDGVVELNGDREGLVEYAALLQAGSLAGEGAAGNTEAEDWGLLTSHISSRLLQRILPGSVDVRPWTVSSVSSAARDAEEIPGIDASERASAYSEANEVPLGFLDIDLKKTWADGAVGRDRTDAARDRSWYLRFLVDGLVDEKNGTDRQKAASEVLGEMQVTFMMVLTLANYSCLEQWKRMLGVCMTCRAALGEVEGFFVEVVRMLRVQMAHCEDVEGGLFELREAEGSRWLRGLLKGFKENVQEVLGGKGKLAEELSELEDLMRERYGWEVDAAILKRGMVQLEDGEEVEVSLDGADQDDEEGEYAPVMVDTGEGVIDEKLDHED